VESQIFKSRGGKWLSKDISKLILGVDPLDFDGAIGNMSPKMMVFRAPGHVHRTRDTHRRWYV